MPIVFAALCPHPPLLIPAIGKENLAKLQKTRIAMEKLEEDFYHSKPETVIVISPHGDLMAKAFTINHAPVLKADFADFGDLATTLEFKNDLGLSYRIREKTETKLPLILTTSAKLDHGSSVPLYYLTQHLKDLKVIPLGYSLLSRAVHFSLGAYIRSVLNQTNKRVAIIASGDLSHRLTVDSPAGYSSAGQEFDQKLIGLLADKKIKEILKIKKPLIKEAGECGYRSLLILLGALAEINFKTEILSYEGPFGVGYLVANFTIR
ncbi:MAG: AmmeMemoRadiSam system protein B [Candidatus Komeilibacteria bacterium]|nr:AmmeMemoRadiSam system protein B [Candidatus Komeilibacteria bacterium]